MSLWIVIYWTSLTGAAKKRILRSKVMEDELKGNHSENNEDREELGYKYNDNDIEVFRGCLSELLEAKLMEVFNVSSYQIIHLFEKMGSKNYTRAKINHELMDLFVDGMLEMNDAVHLKRR